MGENLREIVNGAMLPQFVGKKVSVVGEVSQVNPNGLTFDIKTVDDIIVKINLRKPYRDSLEGLVEILGTAQAKSVICDEIIQFSLADSNEFDAAGHNTLCNLLHSIPDLWKTCA